MRIYILFILLLLSSFASGQSTPFAAQKQLLGSTTAEPRFSSFLLNAPADTSLAGKFKVLEFWATWCKPCLEAVPHLNKLQSEFKEENIIFLSVTDEKEAVASRAFSKVNFETVVVNDTLRAIHQQLRIQFNGSMGIPRTVLIDDENKIVWYGNPNKLTIGMLRRFLKKQTP